MTAGLSLGGDARIYPLDGQVPRGLTPLRQVQVAGSVRLTSKTQGKRDTGPKTSDGRPRDWLTLLVKEELGLRLPFLRPLETPSHDSFLVGLKYVTGKQKFTLEYEGRTSVFEVDVISSQPCDKNIPEDLVPQLEELRIDSAPQIWTVGWDTAVVILPADTLKPLESAKVRTIFPPDTAAHISGSRTSSQTQNRMLRLAVWISRYHKSGISSIFR